jgi:hypothetical protein
MKLECPTCRNELPPIVRLQVFYGSDGEDDDDPYGEEVPPANHINERNNFNLRID